MFHLHIKLYDYEFKINLKFITCYLTSYFQFVVCCIVIHITCTFYDGLTYT